MAVSALIGLMALVIGLVIVHLTPPGDRTPEGNRNTDRRE
jgi:hypothetical protein